MITEEELAGCDPGIRETVRLLYVGASRALRRRELLEKNLEKSPSYESL